MIVVIRMSKLKIFNKPEATIGVNLAKTRLTIYILLSPPENS